MSNKIEGIPEGWELVRIGQINPLEYWINCNGKIHQWEHATSTGKNFVIISKIEKPKQCRPFANAAEAEPFWDRKLRPKSGHAAILRIVVLGEARVGIGNSGYTYGEAFDLFECVDGTPFGIEREVPQ